MYSAVRRLVCDLCHKQFTERGYLTRHRKMAHPELSYGEEEIYFRFIIIIIIYRLERLNFLFIFFRQNRCM